MHLRDVEPATATPPPKRVAAPVRPLAELLTLAAPTVAQMLGYVLMQFTDTLMLSRLGGVEPTAVGNAGMFAFAIISLGFGTMWVVNTLVSQAFGRGDAPACGRYLWAGVWFGLAYGLAVLVVIPFGPAVFAGIGHEPRLASLEAQYLGINLWFTAPRLMAAAGGQFLLAVDRPWRVLAAALAAVAANAGANYVLIFGHLGFDPMGVAGAAWGTNVGGLVELAVIAAMVFGDRSVRRGYGVASWRPRGPEIKTLLWVGLPSGAQVTADVLAWSVFGMVVLGTFGTAAMTANTFMTRYMVLAFMPAFGMSAAVTALVGRYLGRGDPDAAAQRAHLAFKVTCGYMLTCGVAFLLFRRPLIGLFTDDPDILATGATLMIFAAVYQFFDSMYIIYNGALRGGGDTLVPAAATVVLCWGLIVGVAWLVALWFPQFGLAGPWTVTTVYGVCLGLFMLARFRSGVWRRIVIDHPPHRETGPDGVTRFDPDGIDPAATEGEPAMPVGARAVP